MKKAIQLQKNLEEKNDYDEDDTATLEGEEGEETTDEDNEEFNDVEMGSDENFEEN